MTDVSVVIPVRNGEACLPPLLDSLERQTLARERFEVIVVDNGSRDRGAELAAERGARVVTDTVANRSRARNSGAAAASSGLLAFTDADCVVHEGWLESLLAGAGKAPLVAGPVVVTTGARPNPIERFEKLWRFDQESWVRQGWAATANLLVQRRAFESIGGFDTTWRHIGEDVDFCFRARAAGHTLDYCPNAVVFHDAERELRPLLRRSFIHGYSVNQAFYRLDAGYRAWRRPRPLLSGTAALHTTGVPPDAVAAQGRRSIGALAQASYAARMAGSLWAEARRVR